MSAEQLAFPVIGIRALAVLLSFVGAAVVARGQPHNLPGLWSRMNDGGYIDANEPLLGFDWPYKVSALTQPGGQVIYVFASQRGMAMGRFTQNNRWEFWTNTGWSHLTSAVPLAIDQASGLYLGAILTPHPQHADGFLAVADTSIRSGKTELNVHRFSAHIEFDGVNFRQWTGGGVDGYHPTAMRGLIRSFSRADSTFAYNPDCESGILIGIIGNFNSTNFRDQLTATRMDMSLNGRWRRWRCTLGTCVAAPSCTCVGAWHSNNSWIHWSAPDLLRDTFILNPNADLESERFAAPRASFLPISNTYLVTYSYAPHYGSTSESVKACRYRVSTCGTESIPQWEWWNGANGWQACGDYGFVDVAPVQGLRRQQLHWYDDTAVVLYANNGSLFEVLYDGTQGSESFSEPTLVTTLHASPNFNGEMLFCAAVDGGENLWLAYRDATGNIQVRTRHPGGNWSIAETIWERSSATHALSPLALVFRGIADAILFVEEQDTQTHIRRLFALSNALGGPPTELVSRPAVPAADPAHLSFTRRTGNGSRRAGETAAFLGNFAANYIAVDSDGYVYTGRTTDYGVAVHPPASVGPESNHVWSGYWDHTWFPSGVAVDNVRRRVYAGNFFVAAAGNGLVSDGRVFACEMDDLRDRSYGWKTVGPLPARFDRTYFPTILQTPGAANQSSNERIFDSPAGLAVDEPRGLLYVVNALECRIDVFDIVNTQNRLGPFARSAFSNGVSAQGDVEAVVNGMVAANLVSETDPSGTMLSWEASDLASVLAYIASHFPNQPAGTDRDTFLRNVHRLFKAYHDQPVYVRSFGARGVASGQFQFPQGIDVDRDGNIYVVDCENHRVQKWTLGQNNEPVFGFSWGQVGYGACEFLYPVGIAVDDAYNRVYVTDPHNARVQVFDTTGTFVHQFGSYSDAGEIHQLLNTNGVAADDRGTIFLGIDRDLAQFRVADEPPILNVEEPQPCAIVPHGKNTFSGTVTDDWGVNQLVVQVFAGETLLPVWIEPAPPEEFQVVWTLPSNVPTGSPGRVVITATDTIGQTFSRIIHVQLGGEGPKDDLDGDGMPDTCDNCPEDPNSDQADCNGDGIGDACQPDCNENCVPDSDDISSGRSFDCNANAVPDECERVHSDCNCDGNIDFVDINAFNTALQGCEAYHVAYPMCNWLNADCNCDGVVNAADTDSFMACLFGGTCVCP